MKHTFSRYRYSVAECCKRLHLDATGVGDPLDDETKTKYLQFLQMRLDTWEPTHSAGFLFYDAAILNLIHASLCHFDK